MAATTIILRDEHRIYRLHAAVVGGLVVHPSVRSREERDMAASFAPSSWAISHAPSCMLVATLPTWEEADKVARKVMRRWPGIVHADPDAAAEALGEKGAVELATAMGGRPAKNPEEVRATAAWKAVVGSLVGGIVGIAGGAALGAATGAVFGGLAYGGGGAATGALVLGAFGAPVGALVGTIWGAVKGARQGAPGTNAAVGAGIGSVILGPIGAGLGAYMGA